MERNSPRYLGLKLLLLAAPFVLVVLLYLPHAKTSYMLQTSVMEDKIQRLVLTGKRPQVLVAGESRAFYNVVPEIVMEKTGLSTVNIAVGGETLPRVYDSLHDNNILNHHQLIIISVDSLQINDAFTDNLPISFEVILDESFGLRKIRDTYTYSSLLFSSFFSYFKNYLTGYIHNNLHDDLHMDDAAFRNKGYMPNNGLYDPTKSVAETETQWYTNVVTGGTKEREFLRGLNGFGDVNDTVVIYLSPLAPSWRKSFAGTAEPAVEAHFATVIAKAIAPHANMHFTDFQPMTIEGLDDTKFADGAHLNKDGAPLFTAFLVQTLRTRGIIR